MVRKLALFRAMGKRTYVHCTAGINRASLTVLGYLTFVEGMTYDQALAIVRESRPQANPYAVSWEIARERLLAGRTEDVYLYTQVELGGNSIEEGGDWIKRDLESASIGVIQSTRKPDSVPRLFLSDRITGPSQAARVLPVPVGAWIRPDSPRRYASQVWR